MRHTVEDAVNGLEGVGSPPILRAVQPVYELVDVSNITSMNDLWSPVLKKIEAFMTSADKIAEVHPYAKIAWTALSFVPKTAFAQMNRDNRIKPLLESMDNIYTVVLRAEAEQLGKIASQQDIIVKMTSQTTECAYFISVYTSKKRFWKWIITSAISPVDKTIKEYEDAFKKLQEAFQTSAVCKIEIVVFRMLDTDDDMVADINFNDMDVAKKARFNSGKICLSGTRKSILAEITDWAKHPIDDNFPCIFFLHGVAGSGKSAIAHTIARQFHEDKRLGSSYCFDRNVSTLHGGNLFTTISRDLADLDSAWKSCIIIKDGHTSQYTDAVKNQFEDLFLRPGQQIHHIGPILIVIDALDECGKEGAGHLNPNKHYRKDLLRVFENSGNIKRIPKNFRILITSRAEADISQAFRKLGNSHAICKAMSDIEDNSTNQDISLFISDELKGLEKVLDDEWPNKEWHQLLVNKAGRLFQWAYVACYFIKDNNSGLTPVQKLKVILNSGNELDDIYRTVLKQVSPTSNQHYMNIYFRVMGTILLAKEPLPISALIAFYKPGDFSAEVEYFLRPLGPLLHGVTESTIPVQPMHISFCDYILCESRSKEYFIDLSKQHEHFTKMIFNIMSKELKFNICHIESSYQLNKDIVDLDNKIKAHISTQLAYACQFWSDHLCLSPRSTILLEETQDFIKERFLYWLEVLSIKGQVRKATGKLLDTAKWMEVSTTMTHNTDAGLLRDAAAFCTVFKRIIIQSTPHIYLSALPFAPKASIIGKWYRERYPQLLRVEDGGDETWPTVQQVLAGHTQVNCVSISPDGKVIVSGSDDRTLRLWDPATGNSVHGPLEGHTGGVSCVTISPDGKVIVSGSDDRTLRLWDSATGRSVHGPLEGHTCRVKCVAISPDGKVIVSGSDDRTLRLWDPAKGSSVHGPLKGHTDGVNCVAISPDGKVIVSGSDDWTLRLWDPATGSSVHGPLEGHTDQVYCVAISPDGKVIVSGSDDQTLRLWDLATGRSVHAPLEGHTAWVNCAAISPDSNIIVSGSGDWTLRLWDPATGSSVHGPLEGHTDRVNCVAISPDGKVIVSGSNDQTLRLWDPVTGSSVHDPLEGHTDSVNCVAISPDGTVIVSGSDDQTLRLWDLATGSSVHGPLEGHTDYISCVAISPDGKVIVSGSDDQTLRLWDLATGSGVHGPLEGHTDWVNCVAISPDGKVIVSGSDDQTIRLWDLATGSGVYGPLEGHTGSVNCVAISPDGKVIVSGSSDQTIRLWDLCIVANILCQESPITIDMSFTSMSHFITLFCPAS
ncbi:quinon protein alcohol dehydrogenase-like superfamily [Hysterangium stoloniferum]|nr:quinon protein alcohol dehydrogenase-like superfamily [Hysterangium stoloniferum]